MRPFKLTGTISLINGRLFHKEQECLGLTTGNGRRFRIRLSKKSSENAYEFVDTLLHELLHLWLFIVFNACGIDLSAKAQHRIIDGAVPQLIRRLNKELKKRIRK